VTTHSLDRALSFGVAVYADAFAGEPPPASREELEARIERLDATTYAAIHGALERVPYTEFAEAVRAAQGASS